MARPYGALGTAVFLMWRAWRIKRPIVRKARDDPRGLVPTAGTIAGRIVGRTELCLVIMRALRDRDYRRPYLLVGGVGAGKTAVLVQLTKMLAETARYRYRSDCETLKRSSTLARWRRSSSVRKSIQARYRRAYRQGLAATSARRQDRRAR